MHIVSTQEIPLHFELHQHTLAAKKKYEARKRKTFFHEFNKNLFCMNFIVVVVDFEIIFAGKRLNFHIFRRKNFPYRVIILITFSRLSLTLTHNFDVMNIFFLHSLQQEKEIQLEEI